MDTRLTRVVERGLKKKIAHVIPRAGHNAQSFCVICKDDTRFHLKRYHTYPKDTRNRLKTEFEALDFLTRSGVRHVPRPLFRDDVHQVGVYEYVDGRRLEPQELTPKDILEAAAFYGEFRSLSARIQGETFGPASEACLSIEAALKNMEDRVERLESSEDPALQHFLLERLLPMRDRVLERTLRMSRQMCLDLRRPLNDSQRMLSPSDAGFHNILRSDKSGRLTFIDFEYFGWDDPAKLLSDFLLQPDIPVPDACRPDAVRAFAERTGEASGLSRRLAILFPVVAFKWSLILLNPFLPGRGPGRLTSQGRDAALKKAADQMEIVGHILEKEDFLKWVADFLSESKAS